MKDYLPPQIELPSAAYDKLKLPLQRYFYWQPHETLGTSRVELRALKPARCVQKCMVAERVTPSPSDAPPGPDSAFNESGVRSPGSMAPDSAFNESGVRSPEPGIYGSGLRDQQYRSPDELKIPDSGLRAMKLL